MDEPTEGKNTAENDQDRSKDSHPRSIAEYTDGPCWNAEEKAHRAEESHYWRHQKTYNWSVGTIALIAMLAAIAAACFAGGAYYETKRQAQAAADQLSLIFPPRLRINNIYMWPKGRTGETPVLKPGNVLKGSVPVINAGREHALIDDATCIVYWRKGPLPMNRPYFTNPEGIACDKLKPSPVGTGNAKQMAPGDISQFDFEATVPSNYDKIVFFYVLGFIRYSDRLSPHRFVLFGRKYVPSEDRFVVVDNPDYEGQDFQ
jgi:Putative Flp pilus-assembly TadE/G-like